MSATVAVVVAVGVALGLWEQWTEQRRLSRMARGCRTREKEDV